MRETLTVLAGLLLLTLLAALIAPGLVDWTAYRPQIEARLSAALGVETRVGGGIRLRLLPSPRAVLGDVRIGPAGRGTSAAALDSLSVELAAGALARGEFRVSDAVAEGALLTLAVDEAGAVQLPPLSHSGLSAQTSLDKLSIRRSAVIWREAGQPDRTLAPIAAEVSAVSLRGPWRIEGEVAGASVRITTGAIEADGRLRAKTLITGDAMQMAFDGHFLLPAAAGPAPLGLDGAFTLSPGGALALSGRVAGTARLLALRELALDLGGGAAKLEGEGQFRPSDGAGSLALRARRVDLDALVAALAERPGFERALTALPARLDISLDLDQLLWRGEDFTGLALRGRLTPDGLSDATASMRIAGALIGATGAADLQSAAGRLTVRAEDARRVALILARAGLDSALAELAGGLGQIDADVTGAWDGGRLGFERFMLTSATGLRLEGAGELTAARLAARLSITGLDLNSLPPAESLTGLVGRRDLALDLSLANARYRAAPPGSANLDLRREGEVWRLSRLAISGFGGVSVTGSGALLAQGGEIAGRIRAPRFETLAALAGPLLPERVRLALAQAGDGLARLDTGFRLTRSADGVTALAIDGSAQGGRFILDGKVERGGAWTEAALRFDLADRRQAFAALGLPAPQLGGAGRLSLSQAAGRIAGSFAGPGLALALDNLGSAEARLTVQADRPGQVLPAGAATLLPDGLLDASARIRFEPERIALDDVVANLGPARATGALAFARENGLSGRLSVPQFDLRALVAGALGAAPAPSGALWASGRFNPVAPLGEMKLAIEAGAVQLWDKLALSDARFTLVSDGDGLRLTDLAARHAGGGLAGRLGLRREGGLAQLTGLIDLTGLDLASLTGSAVGGRLSGRVELGGSGESPARLIAGLSGAGSLRLQGATVAKLDPAAYARVIAGTGEDASESETDRLQRRLAEALDGGAWALGDLTLPFTLAAGIARLQPLSFDSNGLRVQASGLVDLRALTADLRLGLRPLGPLPKGWPGDAPQIGVAWRGPLSDVRREADVGALANTVAARALAREIERVEAFEADARERAMHSRRLRAEREMHENERKLQEFLKAEDERRIAEEKRAEEARQAEEARRAAEEAKRAVEERRAEEARRAAEARQEQEARRRAESEERARAAAERAAQQPPQPGPLILPGAPRSLYQEPPQQPTAPG
ncbi:MAG: AsmA-like C-terminal region-containing protein, partial [Bosea sp. (in: a-proteobacteria)]